MCDVYEYSKSDILQLIQNVCFCVAVVMLIVGCRLHEIKSQVWLWMLGFLHFIERRYKAFFFFQDSKITLDEYRAQPDNPAAIELGNMFEFYKRGNPDRDIRLTKKLNEETQRFDVWVGENKAMLEEAFSKKQWIRMIRQMKSDMFLTTSHTRTVIGTPFCQVI